MRRVVLLDRDGVLNVDLPTGVLRVADCRIEPSAPAAVAVAMATIGSRSDLCSTGSARRADAPSWRFPAWEAKLSDYWRKKIQRNRNRDRRNFQRLRRHGWVVLRFWGHQIEKDLAGVVQAIAERVALRLRG